MSTFSDPVPDALRLFPGAKIMATDKPLFCRHCDKDLTAQWDRLYATSSVKELVALLETRPGKVVERSWPDGRREWACHFCGRGVD